MPSAKSARLYRPSLRGLLTIHPPGLLLPESEPSAPHLTPRWRLLSETLRPGRSLGTRAPGSWLCAEQQPPHHQEASSHLPQADPGPGSVVGAPAARRLHGLPSRSCQPSSRERPRLPGPRAVGSQPAHAEGASRRAGQSAASWPTGRRHHQVFSVTPLSAPEDLCSWGSGPDRGQPGLVAVPASCARPAAFRGCPVGVPTEPPLPGGPQIRDRTP